VTWREAGARLLQTVIALLALSVIVFWTSRITGDPLQLLLPIQATQDDYDRAAAELGLDRPIIVQYLIYLGDLLHGDLGQSLRSGEEISSILGPRLASSLKLASASLLMTFLIATPLGVVSARHRGRPADSLVKVTALLGQSLPSFWVGLLLIQLFAVNLGWFPAGTDAGALSIVLPAFTMALFGIAGIARLLRSTMIDVLATDYIRHARAKGLPERSVVWNHAIRNSVLPVVSFGGLFFVNMISFAVVVETVFAWPGLGSLAHTAVLHRDFPLIQGVALVGGVVAILVNLMTDILYRYLDPRIRR
jgi:peptide/nickel transport system permease protein